MRPITGEIWLYHDDRYNSGVFEQGTGTGHKGGGEVPEKRTKLNSALLGPHYAGTETRPVNRAVRYLVRAAK